VRVKLLGLTKKVCAKLTYAFKSMIPRRCLWLLFKVAKTSKNSHTNNPLQLERKP
jgi:hypothetical protein